MSMTFTLSFCLANLHFHSYSGLGWVSNKRIYGKLDQAGFHPKIN